MTAPQERRPESGDEHDPEDGEAWSLLEIAQTREFQIPAGIGLAVSVVALLTDSAYAWVITFGYLMLGLPGLVLYLREKPKPEADQSWRKKTLERDADRAVRASLQSFVAQRFAHEEEAERALLQYEQVFLAFSELLLRVRREDSPELLQGKKLVGEIISRLGRCVHLCQQLASLDPAQLVKRVQALTSKGNLSDYDRAELQSLRTKIEARDAILSDLIDHLRANDRLLAELKRSGLTVSV